MQSEQQAQAQARANAEQMLAKLPATKWDRLVAVLEENEPERAIDAPHILERAKKLNMSDMDLFYLLLMRYQEKYSNILLDVLSLYAMISTWIEWIKQVQRCFDIKKGKVDVANGGSNNNMSRSAANAPHVTRTASAAAGDSDINVQSRSSSNFIGSQQSSSQTADSLVVSPLDPTPNNSTNGIVAPPAAIAHPRDSASRTARNRVHSNLRSYRNKGGRSSHGSNNLHWCFDLGADWTWDGSLDFLRDGRVLSSLVEEALDHCGKLGDLQDDHRNHPEALNPGTYNILYPSLADIDRLSKDGPSGGGGSTHVAPSRTPTNPAAAAFDPVSYLTSFNNSRLSCKRRGTAVPPSKALKLIEQQGKNLAAAEHWVARLNGMCEHFLGWDKKTRNGESFLDICNSDALVRPLNEDDERLLLRVHWLAVALYRTVKDPTIIPAPPRMSFILCRDDFTAVLDTSEEDNEISLLVATKCSCLPLNTKLSVTMKDFNKIQLTHPSMQSGLKILPCTVVQGEAYVYFETSKIFMPIWCLFQYYIQQYDGLTWRFEMNRQERDHEKQVLGDNSAISMPPVGGVSPSDLRTSFSSGAMFDLTVQSSAVRRVHDRKVEMSTSTRRRISNLVVSSSATASGTSSSVDRVWSPSSSVKSPLKQAESLGKAKSVGFATVRRGRVAVPSSAAAPSATSPATASSSREASPAEASTSARPPSLPRDSSEKRTDAPEAPTISRSAGRAASSAEGSSDEWKSAEAVGSSTMSSACSPLNRQVTAAVVKSPATTTASSPHSPSSAGTAAAAAGAAVASALPQPAKSKYADCAVAESRSARKANTEDEKVERDTVVGSAAAPGVSSSASAVPTAVLTPACSISCSPSSQMMVSRGTFFYASAEFEEEDEEGYQGTEASTMLYSESRKILRNFTASVVQESERNGIAILSHHFRVSGGPIGKGAFGAVYRALNLDTGRIVAVKQSRLSYDDKTTDLNWREFQTWSMLPMHANVIIFYGASREVDTHQLLLVLEYASGGSIVQLYRQFRPIPEPLFYDHALGMARGIKHLHDHNVIHGDVKPENVLTRSDGSVAITDFGCSRFSIVASDSDSSTLRHAKKESSSWQLFGTAAYMAPEVILNEPHLKSDVWAYACTLLQLWLNQSPWSGGSRRFSAQDSIPLMFYIANEDVVPYTEEQLENTPRWLHRIAKRAFEREVERRCTMGEILSILTECSRAYLQ